MNKYTDELKGTSRGVYLVVGAPFFVIRSTQGNCWWFISSVVASQEFHVYEAWLDRHGLNRFPLKKGRFTTRARALDALEMALEAEPL